MHRFLAGLDENAVLSRHPHGLTVEAHGRVAKIVRAQWATAFKRSPLQIPGLEGVPSWRHLHWLTPEEADALDLDGEGWLMGIRDRVAGRTLREAWLDDRKARSIALRITCRLRDLHEQGLTHGDLQPSNVVIDPDGDVWLIDVALLPTDPGEVGHVAGSVALMAPELWEGAGPSAAADAYALGCLVTWLLSGHYPHSAENLAGWANAHRTNSPDLTGLSTPLAGIVRRLLAPVPAERPPLQELIDALIASGAEASIPPAVMPEFDNFDPDDLLARCQKSPLHLAVFAPRGAGKSRLARRLALFAAYARTNVVLMSGAAAGSAAVPESQKSDGSWSPVLELLRALAEPRGAEASLPSLGGGDRLHLFEQLTDAVFEAAGTGPLLVVWDDFDRLRPDALAWWRHLRDAVDRSGRHISTVVLAAEEREVSAVIRTLDPPPPAFWSRWRATTLRAELRGIPQARWDQLVSLHGATIGGLLAALDHEIGARGVAHAQRETSDTDHAPRTVRAHLELSRVSSAGSRPHSQTFESFYRMLSLNEVILHATKLDDMLREALEIAASLSGAERAFILLRDPEKGRIGSFSVAQTRDVDGRAIPSAHLAASLTIAEEAARTGRTVVTSNAREDGRFSQALSVVDLDLTSVLCVPVRDASGLLGALYVDHRFTPGMFEGEMPRLMEAFGHQLALAINNARRIQELEAEHARLTETQAKLGELLAEREAELHGLEQRVADLSDEVARASADGSRRGVFPDIAFGSRAMERVLSQVQRVARGDIPVVVTGESGVGKELIARAIHEASPRHKGPFIAFDCGAVSETLFESEMFGHIKGAFTGADIDRQGLFAAADGGTIFLDEIGEMPPAMQVKLLRVLQERQIRRVGETASRSIDVRVIAATNRDLAEMVADEEFREDLYYRLAAFVIEIPALRERREDIPLVATALMTRICEDSGRPLHLSPAGARLLTQCDWPGNVRELENTLRTAAVLADGEELGEEELASLVRLRSPSSMQPASNTSPPDNRGRRRKADRLDVVDAMRRASDDRKRAAELLGVSQRTLYRYLKRWDLY